MKVYKISRKQNFYYHNYEIIVSAHDSIEAKTVAMTSYYMSEQDTINMEILEMKDLEYTGEVPIIILQHHFYDDF